MKNDQPQQPNIPSSSKVDRTKPKSGKIGTTDGLKSITNLRLLFKSPDVQIATELAKEDYKSLNQRLTYKAKRRNSAIDTASRILEVFLKIFWSTVVVGLLIVTCYFVKDLVYGIGLGKFTFAKYQEHFLEIVALYPIVNVAAITLVVVKYVFPSKANDDKKESLKSQSVKSLADLVHRN